MEIRDLTDAELQSLYRWVDSIPLTRPKRNIARDFSDGGLVLVRVFHAFARLTTLAWFRSVLMAEIVKHLYPKMVDLHNYVATNAVAKKLYNWKALNRTRMFALVGHFTCSFFLWNPCLLFSSSWS